MNYNNKLQRSQMVLRFKAFSFVKIPRNLCNHVSVSLSLCICISQPLQPLKLRLSEYCSLEKGKLFKAFPKKVYLVYLLTCKFPVCVCRTPRFVWRHVFLSFSPQPPDPYFSLSPYSLSCVSFATFATEIKLPANQWERSKSFMPTRLFPVFISPIVWNMCEHLHYESAYFKEVHKEQEYYIQSGGSCSVNYY